MNNSLFAIKHDQWRTLLFASLLFVAQLLFQLHGLEHLDVSDHEEHNEELCVVCILGSGIDTANLADNFSTDFDGRRFEKIKYSYTLVLNFTFNAFLVRAPPMVSSIV